MGNIKEVFYDEIDPSICSTTESGEFYFYYNLLGIDPIFQSGYEEHEMKQTKLRNRTIKHAIDNGDLPKHPNLRRTIFGISSLKNKLVMVAEY